jgi:hypothetical protein
MATQRAPRGSTRRLLSLIAMVVGALLLLVMPAILFGYAVSGNRDVELPGTLVILTSTLGIALIVIGAALRE